MDNDKLKIEILELEVLKLRNAIKYLIVNLPPYSLGDHNLIKLNEFLTEWTPKDGLNNIDNKKK